MGSNPHRSGAYVQTKLPCLPAALWSSGRAVSGGAGRLGAYDPFFGPGVSRSMSAGFNWDEEKARETREDRGWPGRGRISAAD